MRRRLLLATVIAAVLCGIVFADHHSLRAADTDDDSGYSQISLFAKAVQLIRRIRRRQQSELPRSHLRRDAGMLSSLDPHSRFMDPSDFRDMQDDTRSRFNGLGVEVSVRTDCSRS